MDIVIIEDLSSEHLLLLEVNVIACLCLLYLEMLANLSNHALLEHLKVDHNLLERFKFSCFSFQHSFRLVFDLGW